MGVTRDADAPSQVSLTATRGAPRARDERCLNCDATLAGPFCASCGQRAIPAYPTVHELANDAFHELSGWDGRLATTIRTLFRRPGELTRDFLAGRRARHISPIRLYLMASVVYFLVAAAVPKTEGDPTVTQVGGIRIGVFTPKPGGNAARAADNVRAAKAGELTAAQRDSALKEIEQAPALIRPILRRAIEDPGGFQGGILRALPRALFALLPLFAGILALFYRGRHYPEHLYFALHLHAFVFLALSISQLTKLTGSLSLMTVVGVAVLLWILAYAILSLRRVYGGTLARTLFKGVGIATLYMIAAAPVLIGMLAWAAVRA
jgi:hypothetical protein